MNFEHIAIRIMTIEDLHASVLMSMKKYEMALKEAVFSNAKPVIRSSFVKASVGKVLKNAKVANQYSRDSVI